MPGRGSIALGALTLATVVSLAGCSLQIGEGDVFRPPTASVHVEGRTDLSLRFEDELVRDFDADIVHARHTFGRRSIATTRVRAADMDPDAPLIVSCSGNASDRYGSGVNYAAKILPFGEAVLWDYPGYGDSGGRASVVEIEAIADDLAAWLDLQAGDRPLVLWGHSLGGFVCAELATRTDAVDAVILETSARNISEVTKAWRPWWAPLRLRPDEGLLRFDTATALEGFLGPILVIGAGRDEVLPVELHRDLARSIAAPLVSYIEAEFANHASAGFAPETTAAVGRIVGQLKTPRPILGQATVLGINP